MRFLLHHLLESSARARPDAPAVIDGETTLTYHELDDRAERLADLLVGLGARPGELVGLFLDKSADAVVAIHAVLKTGAAYVPVDPRSPVGRAAQIATSAGVRTLITGTRQAPSWPDLVTTTGIAHLVVPDAPAGALEAPVGATLHTAGDLPPTGPSGAVRPAAIESDLAYILYTSGSTGVPKGVMLTHRNALAFVDWAVEAFEVGPDDRLASLAPLHFDLSVFDVFGAAAAGAALALVPAGAAAFPGQLARFARDQRITVWYSVPSALTMLAERGGLAEEGLPDLRAVLFAGEVFPAKHLRRLMHLLPQVSFANLYGPTETNVCTVHRVEEPPPEGGPEVPIGVPIANAACHLVTEDGRLAGPGEVGELWVRGPTVMRGYRGDPAATAAALVPDPCSPLGDPCYRTGDLAVQDEAGRFHLRGRRDHQVKSRGYRIELGEVETAINAHPAVVECAVVAVPDERVTNRIEAFVATADGVDDKAVLRHCRATLPAYMVPSRLVVVAELPRTSTGKIDRRTLGTER